MKTSFRIHIFSLITLFLSQLYFYSVHARRSCSLLKKDSGKIKGIDRIARKEIYFFLNNWKEFRPKTLLVNRDKEKRVGSYITTSFFFFLWHSISCRILKSTLSVNVYYRIFNRPDNISCPCKISNKISLNKLNI